MAEPAMVGLGAAWLLAVRCLYPYPAALVRAWISRRETKARQDLLQAIIPLLPAGGMIAWSGPGQESFVVCSWPAARWHHQAQGLVPTRSAPWT